MTAIAVLAAVAILSLLLVLQARSQREAQAQWALERRELLNRIQAPGLLPVQPVEGFEMPEREPDEWAQVGQIDISEKWLNQDED